MTSSAAMNI